MKIGDYVTVDEIMNQNVCRWIVLSDIKEGIYGGVEGGIIRIIADTKTESWEKEVELGLVDEDTYLVSGMLEESLIISGVVVE